MKSNFHFLFHFIIIICTAIFFLFFIWHSLYFIILLPLGSMFINTSYISYMCIYILSILHSSPTIDALYIKKNGLNCLLRIMENVTLIFFLITTQIIKKIIIKPKVPNGPRFWEITGRVWTSLLYNIHIVC